MTPPIDYTTLALVCDQIPLTNVPVAGTSDYRKLSQWITSYSRIVDNYCDQYFSLDTYPNLTNRRKPTVNVDGYDNVMVFVDTPVIWSVTGVSWHVPRIHRGIWQVLTVDTSVTIENDAKGGWVNLYRTGGIPFSRYDEDLEIQLSYTGGWSTITAAGASPIATDLPNDFVEAVTELVSWAFNQRKSQTGQPTMNPVTGLPINYPSTRWPTHIVAKLNNYKRSWLPS